MIINDSNILDEKTRGCPTCPTVQLSNFSDKIAEDEWCDYLRTGRLKRFERFEEIEEFERFEAFERFFVKV